MDHKIAKYSIPEWIKETQIKRWGQYIPRELIAYEKWIIDSTGTYDSSGNKYDMLWTLAGSPLSIKIGKKDGRKYIQYIPDGKYMMCCDVIIYQSTINFLHKT